MVTGDKFLNFLAYRNTFNDTECGSLTSCEGYLWWLIVVSIFNDMYSTT